MTLPRSIVEKKIPTLVFGIWIIIGLGITSIDSNARIVEEQITSEQLPLREDDAKDPLEAYQRRLRLNDVFFLTEKIGFVVGGAGTILKTTDGGKSWSVRQIAREDLEQLSFQDRQRAWIIADNDALFVTANGGRSWSRRSPPAHGISRIRFITPETGWLIGKAGLIEKTLDEGRSWQRQSSETQSNLRDIACFSPTVCVAVGDGGTILSTSDGGKTWSQRHSLSKRVVMDHVNVTGDDIAWALGWDYKAGILQRSKDRGETWEEISPGFFQYPTAMFFNSAKRGVISSAPIYLTEDAGNTWTVTWPGGPFLRAIFFINDRLGWAVGHYRIILHTENGGKTWIQQYRENPKKVLVK